MAMKVVNITLTPALFEQLSTLSENTQLSRSDIIRRAVEQYLSLDRPAETTKLED